MVNVPHIEPRQNYLQKEVGTLVAVRQVYAGRVYYYPLIGRRDAGDFSLPVKAFLDMFVREYTADELDCEWRRLADNGNTTLANLAREFDEMAEAYENIQSTLRELAKKSLEGSATSEPTSGPDPSATADDYEFSTTIGGLKVHVNKVGGGTLGRRYAGNWEVTIEGHFEKEILKSGVPMSHQQVAKVAVDFAGVDPNDKLSGLNPSADADV